MLAKKQKKSEINLYKKKKPVAFHTRLFAELPLHLFEDRVLVAAVSIALFFLIGIIYQSNELAKAYDEKQQAKKQRDNVVYQHSYWQQVIESKPDYRDGYIMLALLTNQMGDPINSKVYLKEALEIDPNFEKAKQLQLLIR